MAFNSINFIFLFLPFFLISYFLIENKYKNMVLIVYSVIFYLYANLDKPLYCIFFIFISVVFNYIIAKIISKKNNFKKQIFVFSIIVNLFILFLFKYINFFISIIILVFNKFNISLNLNKINIIMPPGISFYTFSVISYIVDVYKNSENTENDFFNFSLYSLIFTKMLSGPIALYKNIRNYIYTKSISLENIYKGINLFVFGLGSKVIIADRVSSILFYVKSVGVETISFKLTIIMTVSYAIELYFDFLGYSLMAMGIGEVIGIPLPKNFNNPYFAYSISDFFRRWHITLYNWYKEYVYIPLGGNKKGEIRTYINIFVVWLLTGLWHGSDYNYIIWGLLLFVFISVEKMFLMKIFNKFKLLGHMYVLILIPFTFMIFYFTDMKDLYFYLMKICNKGIVLNPNDYIYALGNAKYFLILGIFFITKCPYMLYEKIKNNKIINSILLIVIFIYSLYSIYMSSNDTFLYFNF